MISGNLIALLVVAALFIGAAVAIHTDLPETQRRRAEESVTPPRSKVPAVTASSTEPVADQATV